MGAVAYGAGLFSPDLDPADFGRRFHGHDERIDVESLRLTTDCGSTWSATCSGSDGIRRRPHALTCPRGSFREGTAGHMGAIQSVTSFGAGLRRRFGRAAGHASPKWLTTMGTVLSATVQVGNNGSSRSEHPLVFYAYQVDGQVFQGQRVRLVGRAVDSGPHGGPVPGGIARHGALRPPGSRELGPRGLTVGRCPAGA